MAISFECPRGSELTSDRMSARAHALRDRSARPHVVRRASLVAAGLCALVGGGCGTARPLTHPPGFVAGAGPRTTAAPVIAAPSPLRRLTNEEYDNTVHDLLGDTTRPASGFAPDEMVAGFENNTVSPVTQTMVERYASAAETLAEAAASRVDSLAPRNAGETDEACARRFIERFAQRAYRRPLDEAERAALLATYAEKAARAGHAKGIARVVQTVLQSPKFLYRLEPADGSGARTRALTGFEIATRLSFFLWASTPDDALLEAAATGALDTAEGVAAATRKLLVHPRAAVGIRSFHRQWLGLRELETASKNPTLYASFTPELRAAMVEETLSFTTHAVLRGGDTVATLLTSPQSFVNAPLAKLYGITSSSLGRDHVLIDLPAGQRSGLLTHASVLALLAYPDESSPILRGKFVREKLLCDPIAPPPPSFVITLPKPDPTRTKRDRFERHRMDPRCASCHDKMDPAGFAFEHYDAIGAFRTVDGAFPVDAAGGIAGTRDADGKFDGALALGAHLARSNQVRRCLATHWVRAALGRVEQPEDDASIEGAYQAFARGGFDVRELIVAITKSDAFRYVGFAAVAGGAP